MRKVSARSRGRSLAPRTRSRNGAAARCGGVRSDRTATPGDYELEEDELGDDDRLPLLGHVRIETTQEYAQIQPAQLKESVGFYEGKAVDALTK